MTAYVVAVEVPPALLAMHPIVGGIEVEVERLLGWPPERADELLDHLLVDGDRPVPVGLLLEATQGRLAGQHPVGIDGGLQGDDLTAFAAWKGSRRRGTFCHGG